MCDARILSLGSLNADFEVRVEHFPGPDESLRAKQFLRAGGGKAANKCLLVRKLGTATTLLASVGDDDLRDQALEPLRRAGIDLSRVATAQGCPTGVVLIMVSPDGKKAMVMAENANGRWTDAAADSVFTTIATAPEDSVFVTDCEVPAHLVRRAITAASVREFQIILDPSPPERVDEECFAQFAAITPNASEARALTGIDPSNIEGARAAADKLAAAGVRAVYLKLREGGCVLACQGKHTLIASMKVEVVDTTGAGDAFAGALTVALLERRDPVEAGCFAVAAAQFAVTGFGAQAGYPDRSSLEQLADRIRNGARAI
jgi:ribokinase